MNARLVAVALGLACAACQTDPVPTTSAEPAQAAPNKDVSTYGAPIGAGEKVALSAVLAEPKKFLDKPVIIEAEVRRACAKKGCWMEVAESNEKSAPSCRVTFKDYGFFVPKDSAGSRARMQGTVAIETVAASYVEHLEAEGARFPNKKPDGTADEVRFVATGVELSR